VRVRACGFCGSDLEKLRDPAQGPGRVLGHEVVGLLEQEGAPPRRVALAHHVPCGACALCRRGHSSLCRQFVSTDLVPGGLAEYLTVTPQHLDDAVFTLPDGVDDLRGTLLEPLSCVLRAFAVAHGLGAAYPLPGVTGSAVGEEGPRPRRALVAGCGAVGLLFLAAMAAGRQEGGAAQAGPGTGDLGGWATPALYLEPDEKRAALARALGARPLDDADRGLVDVCFLTAPAALERAVAALAPGGRVVVFAAPGTPVGLDLDAVYRGELTLAGVRSGSPAHLRAALALLASGRLPLDWFEPEVVPLAEVASAVGRYERGASLKVVARL